MHFMHNHVVDIDGDIARMRNYMHNINSSSAGIYFTEAERTPQGWRFSRLRLEEQFIEPERVLPGEPG